MHSLLIIVKLFIQLLLYGTFMCNYSRVISSYCDSVLREAELNVTNVLTRPFNDKYSDNQNQLRHCCVLIQLSALQCHCENLPSVGAVP